MRADPRAIAAAAALAVAAAGAAWAQALTAPAQPTTQPQPQAGEVQPHPPASAACEASNLAWLVGKPRSAIPVPVNPSLRRVYCSTCFVTEDYVPGRTDIVFDSETGLITAVKCG
jgi:hypothetical protein